MTFSSERASRQTLLPFPTSPCSPSALRPVKWISVSQSVPTLLLWTPLVSLSIMFSIICEHEASCDWLAATTPRPKSARVDPSSRLTQMRAIWSNMTAGFPEVIQEHFSCVGLKRSNLVTCFCCGPHTERFVDKSLNKSEHWTKHTCNQKKPPKKTQNTWLFFPHSGADLLRGPTRNSHAS